MRKTRLCSALMVACGGAMLSAGPAALAQNATTTLDRVEITGSNIRRINAETASPVQTLTREDIDKSGRSSVAELLQTLAVDNQGSVPKNFGAGFASGGSGISLRGLGAASTLVLLNGRRIAPFGLADDGQKVFSDLNLIPLEAVERVEILKDGGSAIYGSDAIAGVVNVILRKDYQGLALNASYGASQYWNGKEKRAALTGGFGDLQKQGFNILANLEVGRQGEIYNRDITDRDYIGRQDLRYLGFTANETVAGISAGGNGAITTNNAAGSAINGNVRNPVTLDYYNRGNLAGVGFTQTFPGAACSNFTSHPQGDPGGGCLNDAAQEYLQIQPAQKYINFFARGTLNILPALQGYAEFNWYNNKNEAYTTPSQVSNSVGFPGGPVSNAGVALGAAHPDNPYFGTEARLRYLAVDNGPRVRNGESDFYRALVGLKGTGAGWDYDTALLYSETKGRDVRLGYLQRDVTFALLNPTPANVAAATAGSAAYAALPAGNVWRIAENAGLNSPARLRGAVAADHVGLLVQDHPDRRQGVARADAAARRPARHRRRRRAAPREHRADADDRHRARQHHRPRLLGLRRRPHRHRRVRGAAGAGAEAARGFGGGPLRPLLRRRQLDDAQGRPQVHADPRAGVARHVRARLSRAELGRERRRRPGGVLDRHRSAALQPRHRGGLRARRTSP